MVMTAVALRKHSPGLPSPRAPAPQVKPATLSLMQSTVLTQLSTAQVQRHISLNPQCMVPRNLLFKRWHDLLAQVCHISLNPQHVDPHNQSFKRWHDPLTLGRGRRRHWCLQRDWQQWQLQWRWWWQCLQHLQQLAGAGVGFEVDVFIG